MATIKFSPVCSHCGNVLYGVRIDYERTYDEYDECDIKIPSRIGYVSPRTCPCCGEHFENITMPTSLPYTETELPSKIAEFENSLVERQLKENVIKGIETMARHRLGLYVKE